MINILPPNLNGKNDAARLQQVSSYLFQMAEQLNYALTLMDDNAKEVKEQVVMLSQKSEAPAAETAKETFESIKALIIKSADIVSAYSETITRNLSGTYVAQSDFGTFRQETKQSITENASSIVRAFEDIESIESDVTGLRELVSNAWIKTGLLEDDAQGYPIYGVEVGQMVSEGGTDEFKKFARFTSDRLSFYDRNETEVAYVSDYVLHITQAEIPGGITLGRYKIDTSNGLSFLWV